MNSKARIDSSFRDPSGFVFCENGRYYRQINERYRETYTQLMNCGLYSKLIEKRFLIPHQQVEKPSFPEEGGFCVIEPEQIAYISYPYEWSFSQLKDAAILTLNIQKIAIQHGMSLKDAAGYNVQFRGSIPVFIDTLSFEKFSQKPWVAYRQFCQHFLAPLALASYSDFRLTQLLKAYIDGIPLDLAAKLLPGRTRMRFGLLMHLHIHAKSQRKYANKGRSENVQKKIAASQITANKAIAIVDHLISTVNGLTWKQTETEWGDYNQSTNYQNVDLDEKSSLIVAYVDKTGIEQPIIQDIGANDGKFGRIVSKTASLVVCHDVDETAVEKNYLMAKSENDPKILPLVQNLVNPSPAIGWGNCERENLAQRGPVDISMALALIHHIAISNNVTLDKVAKYLASLSRYLIIEFVAKEDSQVKRLLATREDIFPDYTKEGFEQEFSKFFSIIQSDQVSDTQRTLYLMKSQMC